MAHVRFHRRKRVHPRLSEKNRTQRHTRRNRWCFGWGALSLPSDRFAWFGNPAWPGLKTANFAAFGAWSWVLPKNAESLRDSDALMRVAVPRRRGPAGLRDLFRFCRNCGLYPCAQGLSVCARRGVVSLYPRSVSHGSEILRGQGVERQTLPLLGLGRRRS